MGLVPYPRSMPELGSWRVGQDFKQQVSTFGNLPNT
jgi:hypothetical protein